MSRRRRNPNEPKSKRQRSASSTNSVRKEKQDELGDTRARRHTTTKSKAAQCTIAARAGRQESRGGKRRGGPRPSSDIWALIWSTHRSSSAERGRNHAAFNSRLPASLAVGARPRQRRRTGEAGDTHGSSLSSSNRRALMQYTRGYTAGNGTSQEKRRVLSSSGTVRARCSPICAFVSSV